MLKKMHQCTGEVIKCNMQNEEVNGKVRPQPVEHGNVIDGCLFVLICDNCCTFFGEKTPNVPPSSRMATPISASRASLLAGWKNIDFFSTNSKIQR